MSKTIELVTVISSLLGLVVTGFSLWSVAQGVIKRLVIIHNRLTSLRGLLTLLTSRMNDLERFMVTHHDYHVPGVVCEVEESFSLQYEDEDTGF
ncbi:hypothetical protein [Microcoleus sp. CAWBG640]|uniref:hypothetical protein n=1 Tax=Microcoleus sp. CAWBG640 TaxID=2841653 RepID=UPI00312B4181